MARRYRSYCALLAAIFTLIIVFSGRTSAATAEATPCPGMSAPRLVIGKTGRVVSSSPANIRQQPDVSSPLVGQIPSGDIFEVLDGPRCSSSFTWWQVKYHDLTGWTIELRSDAYLLEP